MNCDEARALYSDYGDAVLEEDAKARLEAHLAECPACEADYAGYRAMLDELHSLPEPTPPDGFHKALMHRVYEAHLKTRGPVKRALKKQPPSFKPFAYAAAGVVACFFLLSALVSGVSGVMNATGLRGGLLAGGPAGGPVTEMSATLPERAAAQTTDSFMLTAVSGAVVAADNTAAEDTYVKAVVGGDNATLLAARYFEQSFNIFLTVENLSEAIEAIDRLGGYNINANTRYDDSGGGYGDFTRRVDANSYAMVKDALRGLGEVTNESESVGRMADEVYDLQAQLAAKEREAERLTALLRESRTMSVLAAVERRLGMVENERDEIRGRLNQLYEITAMPYIYVRLYETPPEPAALPDTTFAERVRTRFVRSLNSSVIFMENCIVFLSGAFIPLLVTGAVIALVWTLFVKRLLKRKGARS